MILLVIAIELALAAGLYWWLVRLHRKGETTDAERHQFWLEDNSRELPTAPPVPADELRPTTHPTLPWRDS